MLNEKNTKETRGPKSINYLLFTRFWWGFFLMHSLRKFLSETCITSLYYYCRFWHKRSQKGNLNKMNFLNFHPILMHFFFCSVHLYELLMDNIFFNYLISKGGLKGFQIPHFAYLKGKRIFIFILILTWWFCCCWKNCIVRFPLSFTVSEINFIDRDRKVQISIKMCYFIPKKDANSEILHIW